MSVNWFPGHMVKARREIQENIKLVDVIVEILDARAPRSTRNPDLEAMCGRKQVLYVLNKRDLTDQDSLKRWISQFQREGKTSVTINATTGEGLPSLFKAVTRLYEPAVQVMLSKNMRARPPRVMIVGIPNVGKSTLINAIMKRKVVRTGPTPGVTRGKQWVRIDGKIDLLDTPGLMWPKIGDPEQGLKLAALSTVGERAYQEIDVAKYVLDRAMTAAPDEMQALTGLESFAEQTPESMLEKTAFRRRLLDGEQPDLLRAAQYVLSEFRKGKLGRFALDEIQP